MLIIIIIIDTSTEIGGLNKPSSYEQTTKTHTLRIIRLLTQLRTNHGHFGSLYQRMGIKRSGITADVNI